MSDILNKNIVLVLNRHWQAIHVCTPQELPMTALLGSLQGVTEWKLILVT